MKNKDKTILAVFIGIAGLGLLSALAAILLPIIAMLALIKFLF